MENKQQEKDFRYFDNLFCTFLHDWAKDAERKVKQIEKVREMFEQTLKEKPVGMILNYEVIKEFNSARERLERCHTAITIELMKLRGLHMYLEAEKGSKEDAKEGEGYA